MQHMHTASPTEFGAKVKTMKISSGASGGVFAKVCTRENTHYGKHSTGVCSLGGNSPDEKLK